MGMHIPTIMEFGTGIIKPLRETEMDCLAVERGSLVRGVQGTPRGIGYMVLALICQELINTLLVMVSISCRPPSRFCGLFVVYNFTCLKLGIQANVYLFICMYSFVHIE